MKELKEYYRENKIFCMAVVLLAVFVAAMLLSFNFKGHDYEFHIQRMGSIAEAIRFKGLGAFPNRIFSTNLNGYGYANPIFYGDIFLYPFSLLMLVGLNGIYAYRIMNVCLYVFCFCSTFWCIKQVLKDTETSLLGAVLYTFSAYFAVDVFLRSAIGESFAYMFLPFVTYGFYCTVINREMPVKHRLFLVLGMSGIILSHLISTVVVTVTLCIMFVVYYKKWVKNSDIVRDLVCMALLAAAICAFFVFPLLEQMLTAKFLVTTENRFSFGAGKMHVASWIAPHGFWKMLTEQFPEVAKASWFPGGFGFVLTALLLIWVVNIKKLNKRSPVILLIVSLLLIQFAHGWILPLDKLQGLLGFMQFPYRVLLLASLFMSIFGIYAVHTLKSKKINCLLLFMCVISCTIVIYSSYKIIREEIPNMDREYTLTSNSLGSAEYVPAEMVRAVEDRNFGRYTSERGSIIESNHKDVIIEKQTNDGHGRVELDFSNNRYTDTTFEVPLIYYKGYSASDAETGEKYEVSVSDNGLVKVNVGGAQSGSIVVRYTGTAVQHVSDIISILTILLLFVYLIKPQWIEKLKRKFNKKVTQSA